ncbi:APC family permease [Mycetocola zhadangensis]|uniref:APC family permease n=1 Tax=Mycetocola zhadangensis TaxID=1164595 RepID=A0A3L7IS62_9MICO|nr:APC family permease [Mycetocola zhadangensis]RLQ81036.1 APC family permease [Mycetocola zhadangensis]GGF04189.1 amino acid transporter [Mycetocola zhadangensis]
MAVHQTERGLSKKGLSAGSVGLLGAIVIGISCIAPAYTMTAALGPTVSEVGLQVPAIILVGFIPMLLVAFGYRELNRAMPDSGTSFTWATRAFGPWIGWMTGWGLIAATILVLSNLAGIAVDFFYLMLAQIFGNPDIANLALNPVINVVTCLAFMAAATAISYRDMQTTQKVQYVLVGFQLIVLLLFGIVAFYQVANGSAFDPVPVSLEWFNPFAVQSFSAFAAGLSLSIFIFWGWDVTLTMNEETKGSRSTPGRAATLTVLIIVVLYLLIATASISFAGIGTGEFGLGNEDIQGNVFFALAGPVLGPLAILVSIAVLSSSAASLQSTFVSPARTLLAMGHYGALPERFSRISPRFLTPGFATIVSSVVASAFYAIMRFVSEDVLWDTITALGMMICFYYGLTAFAAVWYFRKQLFVSVRNFFFQLLFPLVGGIILAVLFYTTITESMDPEYGSGSNIGGVGLVFILGMAVIVSGIVLMIIQAIRRPAFFRGETLERGASNGRDDEELDELPV